MSENTERTVAGNFELTLNLTDSRGIRVTGYVYNDDIATDINRRVDAYQEVLDRQAARSDIIVKRAQIETAKSGLKNLVKEYERMLVLTNVGKGLTSSEQQVFDNFGRNKQHLLDTVEELEEKIRIAREKFGIKE